jgi:hypothetical protein
MVASQVLAVHRGSLTSLLLVSRQLCDLTQLLRRNEHGYFCRV